MLSEPNISYKPFWGICRPLNSWRANSPNPIQIYCAEKAMYHLSKQGVKFVEESITRNKKTNRINFVYLDLEIAGFGIHLINPDLKMEI